VIVMSPLPAIAVAGDSELIESTAGVGLDGGVTIGGCSVTVGRVGAGHRQPMKDTIAISRTLVN
jgi:hypothetical protein